MDQKMKARESRNSTLFRPILFEVELLGSRDFMLKVETRNKLDMRSDSPGEGVQDRLQGAKLEKTGSATDAPSTGDLLLKVGKCQDRALSPAHRSRLAVHKKLQDWAAHGASEIEFQSFVQVYEGACPKERAFLGAMLAQWKDQLRASGKLGMGADDQMARCLKNYEGLSQKRREATAQFMGVYRRVLGLEGEVDSGRIRAVEQELGPMDAKDRALISRMCEQRFFSEKAAGLAQLGPYEQLRAFRLMGKRDPEFIEYLLEDIEARGIRPDNHYVGGLERCVGELSGPMQTTLKQGLSEIFFGGFWKRRLSNWKIASEARSALKALLSTPVAPTLKATQHNKSASVSVAEEQLLELLKTKKPWVLSQAELEQITALFSSLSPQGKARLRPKLLTHYFQRSEGVYHLPHDSGEEKGIKGAARAPFLALWQAINPEQATNKGLVHPSFPQPQISTSLATVMRGALSLYRDQAQLLRRANRKSLFQRAIGFDNCWKAGMGVGWVGGIVGFSAVEPALGILGGVPLGWIPGFVSAGAFGIGGAVLGQLHGKIRGPAFTSMVAMEEIQGALDAFDQGSPLERCLLAHLFGQWRKHLQNEGELSIEAEIALSERIQEAEKLDAQVREVAGRAGSVFEVLEKVLSAKKIDSATLMDARHNMQRQFTSEEQRALSKILSELFTAGRPSRLSRLKPELQNYVQALIAKEPSQFKAEVLKNLRARYSLPPPKKSWWWGGRNRKSLQKKQDPQKRPCHARTKSKAITAPPDYGQGKTDSYVKKLCTELIFIYQELPPKERAEFSHEIGSLFFEGVRSKMHLGYPGEARGFLGRNADKMLWLFHGGAPDLDKRGLLVAGEHERRGDRSKTEPIFGLHQVLERGLRHAISHDFDRLARVLSLLPPSLQDAWKRELKDHAFLDGQPRVELPYQEQRKLWDLVNEAPSDPVV